VEKGLIRTFQSSTLIFSNLSVLDNIRVGSHRLGKNNILNTLWGGRRVSERNEKCLQQALRIMELTELSQMKLQVAQSLSHGYRRILGVAVALAGDPKILMVDEPMTGMNAEEVRKMLAIIRKIHEQGVTILIVEHNMRVVMELCERLVVINFGEKLADGSCDEIRKNPAVINAYLGGAGCQ
jgi:branched-chain amino acid transport system ATP-binding protein